LVDGRTRSFVPQNPANRHRCVDAATPAVKLSRSERKGIFFDLRLAAGLPDEPVQLIDRPIGNLVTDLHKQNTGLELLHTCGASSIDFNDLSARRLTPDGDERSGQNPKHLFLLATGADVFVGSPANERAYFRDKFCNQRR
jgi:hypothetical protein